MNPTQADVNRAVAKAHELEAQGYFGRARGGDGRAASLFSRLVAYEVNRLGSGTDWGWLSKSPVETNYDGYADGAIVFSNDPSAVMNVLKIVVHVGEAPSSIGSSLQERRSNNHWVKPVALTDDEMAYLLSGGVPVPVPPSTPVYPPYPGDAPFDALGNALFTDYARAEHAPDAGMGRWFGRTEYDWLTGICQTLAASIAKHEVEWRAGLNDWRASVGKPPIQW